MKVGDIVMQHGRNIKGRSVSKRLGVVIKIQEIPESTPEKARKNMEALIGRCITVMWDSGKVHENFSEKMLEVVVEPN